MSTRDFDELLEGDISGNTARGNHQHEEPTGSGLDRWWEGRTWRVQQLFRWGAPALVVLIAAFTRLFNLGYPRELVFDETFYVKDAWSLFNLGYEASWPAGVDKLFSAGQTNIFLNDPSFVVHPPLGKWLIALGMAALGPGNTVGWRISTALVGILAVVLIMLIAKYLFKSTVLATVAGLFMAIDGNAIVMSRVSLLDNFVMFFALAGFGAIMLDRQWMSVRLAAWISARESSGRSTDWGPALIWRPWLIAAAIAFGATAAVKWNGLYFLAGFAVYTLVVDALARRRSGIQLWGSGTAFRQAPITFILTVPVAIVVYMSTWIGWFVTDNGYYRNWSSAPGNAWSGPLAWVPQSLQSFWHFQAAVYAYHVGEDRPHGYQANPLTWLFMVRPTGMWLKTWQYGEGGCTVEACRAVITGIANPLIWWGATAAILYLVYRLVRYREWRVGLVLMAFAAGYLPWLLYLGRTVFQFYTIAFEPYMILALTLVVGIIAGKSRDPSYRRVSGIGVVAVFLGLVVLLSVFYWPLWTGIQLDYNWMRVHWWLNTWS